jgi:hypothetical protein
MDEKVVAYNTAKAKILYLGPSHGMSKELLLCRNEQLRRGFASDEGKIGNSTKLML